MKRGSMLSSVFRSREDKFHRDARQNFRILLLLLAMAWLVLQGSLQFYVSRIHATPFMIVAVPLVMFGLFLLTFRVSPIKPKQFMLWVYGGFYFMVACLLWMIVRWNTNYVLLFGLAMTMMLTSVFFESRRAYFLYLSITLTSFFGVLLHLYGAEWQEVIFPFLVMSVVSFAGFLYLQLKFQTREKLKEQDDLLSSFYQHAPSAILITDPLGRIMDANQKAIQLMGEARQLLLGKPIHDFLQESYSEEAFRRILGTVLEKGFWHDKVEFSNAMGEIFWGEQTLRRFQVGKDRMIYFTIANITGELMNRVAIRERDVKYRLLMEEASDGILLFDIDGEILEANAKAGDILDAPVEELIGRSFLGLLGEDESFSLDGLRNAKEPTVEREIFTLKGEPVALELSIRSVSNDYFQVIFRDVSRRKASEAALIQSESRFRALIENSRDVVFIVDSTFRIQYVSPSFERLLQIDPKRVLESSVTELVAGTYSEHLQSALERVLEKRGNQEELQAIVIQSASGVRFFFEVVLTNLLGEPEVQGIVLNLHDISARRRTEDQLEQVNFELDSFIYKSSHDMRAPLMSILGLVNLARKAEEGELTRYFDLMEKGVHRLDKFIRDLTHYSRNDRMKVETKPINLHELVHEIVGSLRFMKNLERVRVTVDIKTQHLFHSDPMRVSIILSNLISNAVKYHDLSKYNPFVKLEVWIEPQMVKILVKDNGSGIESPYLDKIFDMFYRASELSDGSGLGLYVAQSVVKKLNGTLSVQSEFRQGSTFILELPNMKPSRAAVLLEDDMEEEDELIEESGRVIPLHHRAKLD